MEFDRVIRCVVGAMVERGALEQTGNCKLVTPADVAGWVVSRVVLDLRCAGGHEVRVLSQLQALGRGYRFTQLSK